MSAPEVIPPTVVPTPLEPVEYAAFGRGPAVLCLLGAMGGHACVFTHRELIRKRVAALLATAG